jgi:hypothetical protein
MFPRRGRQYPRYTFADIYTMITCFGSVKSNFRVGICGIDIKIAL